MHCVNATRFAELNYIRKENASMWVTVSFELLNSIVLSSCEALWNFVRKRATEIKRIIIIIVIIINEYEL